MAILAQACLDPSVHETNLLLCVVFAMAIGAVERHVALRAFAAQLGYFARRSKRLLASELDMLRFMSPVADVLSDLGDELRHLHLVHGLAAAPQQVLTSLQLLGAVSKRAVHGASLHTSTRNCQSVIPIMMRKDDMKQSGETVMCAPIDVSLFDALVGDTVRIGPDVPVDGSQDIDQVVHPVHPPGIFFGRVSTDADTVAVDLVGSWVPAPSRQQEIIIIPESVEHSVHDVVEIFPQTAQQDNVDVVAASAQSQAAGAPCRGACSAVCPCHQAAQPQCCPDDCVDVSVIDKLLSTFPLPTDYCHHVVRRVLLDGIEGSYIVRDADGDTAHGVVNDLLCGGLTFPIPLHNAIIAANRRYNADRRSKSIVTLVEDSCSVDFDMPDLFE